MSDVALAGFVKPYFIAELGTEGLMSSDIAMALGVEHRSVLEKLRRKSWAKSAKWRCIVLTIHNSFNNRSYEAFAFDKRAAKAFVARWGNETGDSYLDFLFDCEEFIEEGIPKLQAQLDLLRKEIEALKAPKKKEIAGWTVTITKGVRRIRDIFGEEHIEIEREKVRYCDLNENERAAAALQHKTRIQRGISTSINQDINPDDEQGWAPKHGEKTGKVLVMGQPKPKSERKRS